MLRVEAVSKVYDRHGKSVTALRDVTLDIPRGDFVSVVGPSGSGKSTLLLTLGGMLSPSAGRVLIDGRSLYDLSADMRARLRRKTIGFIFRTFNLVPYLSALENVELPLFLSGMDNACQRKKAEALLGRVGLSDRLGHEPSELSVGQQQRVALARTLANDPEVILADEPTGNLDPGTSSQIMEILQEINQEGKTVVVVTHDPMVGQGTRRTLRLLGGAIQA